MRCTRRRAQGTGLASPARIATLLRHFGGRFFRVADHVKAVDENCTQLYGVVAKAAIVPIEIWIAKYVATDLSDDYQQALASILHTPILSVNVALHNWRFLGKSGISVARLFYWRHRTVASTMIGFGFFANVRFHPDKPIVPTFLCAVSETWSTPRRRGRQAGFVQHVLRRFRATDPGADAAAVWEERLRRASRYCRHHSPSLRPCAAFRAGILLWQEWQASADFVLSKRFQGIAFGHSELNGTSQAWETAAREGKHALTRVLELM